MDIFGLTGLIRKIIFWVLKIFPRIKRIGSWFDGEENEGNYELVSSVDAPPCQKGTWLVQGTFSKSIQMVFEFEEKDCSTYRKTNYGEICGSNCRHCLKCFKGPEYLSFKITPRGSSSLSISSLKKTKKVKLVNNGLDVGRFQDYWISLDRDRKSISIGKCDIVVENRNNFLEENKMDAEDSNLDDINKEDFMLSANLSLEIKKIYENIRGPTKTLSRLQIKYIGKCLENPKSDLAEILATGKKYIRVTLGTEKECSPGIGYVLEIWPKGGYSPVHAHADASAIVRVLHGEIKIKIYNKTSIHSRSDDPPYMEFVAREGQFTWMDQEYYQCHQLVNESDDFCATLQCYSYRAEDNLHWQTFDYKDVETKKCKNFHPSNDISYTELFESMNQKMFKEESEHEQCTEICQDSLNIKDVNPRGEQNLSLHNYLVVVDTLLYSPNAHPCSKLFICCISFVFISFVFKLLF